jgi:hypothetical protein
MMKRAVLGLAVAAAVFVAGCDLLGLGEEEETPGPQTDETGTVATPTASPGAGAVAAGQPVTLSTATAGATIYYTVDGTDPSDKSTVYKAAITVSANTTIKAFATKSNMENSGILTAEYTIDNAMAAAPTASRDTGTYSAALSVTLTPGTAGGKVYYTVNGAAVPSEANGTLYTSAIAIAVTTTLRAVTVKAGMTDSPVMVKVYTIAPATPEPEPEPVPDPLPPAQSEPEENFTIVANSKGVTITAYNGFAKEMAIPSKIKGQPVTAIGANVFKGKFLTSVYIPGSVTEIGDEAFSNNQLTSVHIPNGVTEIGDGAFWNNELTSVTIGNAVKTIGWMAFSSNKLTSVTIPNSVSSIGLYAFSNNQLASVTIPAGVSLSTNSVQPSFGGLDAVYNAGGKLAGTYTRGGGNWVKGIQIQAGYYWYTEGGGRATVTGYTGSGPVVAIPGTLGSNQVTAIGAYVFEDRQLTSVTIPSGVTVIGQDAFADNQLTSVDIPDSVTRLDGFDGNKLTSVTIPDSVTFLSGFAGNQLTSVTIGNGVTSIGDEAFYNNQLTGVTIPDSVTAIGDVAFNNNKLTSVTIPDSVTEIGSGAFGNNQLTSVTIPNGVTAIEGNAFHDNQLTGVTIPDSVTYIGISAFTGNKLTSATIGNGVTIIGGSAFSDNKLASVTIPDSVTEIGEHAFYLNQLTSVTIPNSVTEIGTSAFTDNPLTSVTMPAGVSLSSGYTAFPGDLDTVYDNGDKQAGTYTRSGTSSTTWTKSGGTQNVAEGIWTGQDSEGNAFSVIFVGNQVFLPVTGDFPISSTTGTFTFEKNAGICSISDRFQQGQVAIPFTINGASMKFGPDPEYDVSVTLAKDTGTFSIPADIGGVWTSQDGYDGGFVFINNIVYAYETGSSMQCEYTYGNGSGSISLDDPPRFVDFTVSGDTLTWTWRGIIPATTFVLTRQV